MAFVNFPPASEASREVENLTERKKSTNPRIWCQRICLSVSKFDHNYLRTCKTEWAEMTEILTFIYFLSVLLKVWTRLVSTIKYYLVSLIYQFPFCFQFNPSHLMMASGCTHLNLWLPNLNNLGSVEWNIKLSKLKTAFVEIKKQFVYKNLQNKFGC